MKRKLATFVVLFAVIGAGSLFVVRHFTLDEIAAQESRLRLLLAERPLTSFLAGLLAYTVLSFVPPTTGKSLVFGWLFGLSQGVLMANLGLTIAAVLSFLASRHLFRDALRSRFALYLARLDRAIERDGAYYVFAMRMMHAPYTLTNYVMGTTCLRIRSFWWSTQLGLLPGNFVFVYAGTQLPTVQEAARRGLTSIFSPQLIAAFVLIGVFPLAMRRVTHRLWQRFKKERDAGA